MCIDDEHGGPAGRTLVDLGSCPACADGCLSINGDGCFKIRKLRSKGMPNGAPLTPSAIGSYEFLPESNSLESGEMNRFRDWRVRRGIVNRQVEKTSDTSCPEYKTMAPSKTSSKTHYWKGIYLGVCRHNVACRHTGRCIDTVLTCLHDGISCVHTKCANVLLFFSFARLAKAWSMRIF
jgi:hypothetical protein